MHRYHQKLRSSFRSLQYLPVFSSHPLRKVLHPLLLFRSLRQTAPPLFGYVLNSRLQTLFSVGYSLPLTVSPKHFLPHPLLHRSAHLRFPGRLHLPARSLFHEWLPARSAVRSVPSFHESLRSAARFGHSLPAIRKIRSRSLPFAP